MKIYRIVEEGENLPTLSLSQLRFYSFVHNPGGQDHSFIITRLEHPEDGNIQQYSKVLSIPVTREKKAEDSQGGKWRKSFRKSSSRKKDDQATHRPSLKQLNHLIAFEVWDQINLSFQPYAADESRYYTDYGTSENINTYISASHHSITIFELLFDLLRPGYKVVNASSLAQHIALLKAPQTFTDVLFSVTQDWDIQFVYVRSPTNPEHFNILGIRIRSPEYTDARGGLTRTDLLLRLEGESENTRTTSDPGESRTVLTGKPRFNSESQTEQNTYVDMSPGTLSGKFFQA
ncbi:hypothetical protein GZ77_09835 [Endozoicomonas montiporae]|uniref:Uncharacterized protein n=2 Tax=Endozoicomonas montiporae TaxID=1027273 RepID=A0A081N837_9GAMM|nr:hypothetical protein [Endozoicomonas montiporae]AMO55504.1 hypothetical protein EZMO1_1313 [Endozoicomonas montiporae CL-33]KEQ14610.1 hypothetical protein GZ77_09835 [Endozoicomonas montiporae]